MYCGFVQGSTAPSWIEQRRIGNDKIKIVIDSVAEALANGARAYGAIEAEERGFGRCCFEAACFAGEFFAEMPDLRICNTCLLEKDFAGFAITDLHRIHDALMEALANHDTVRKNKQRL